MDKDLEKALTEYKVAVKCDDKLGEAYYHMGLILEKMNNRSLALEQFKQAVKVSSEADYSQDAKHRMNMLSQKKGELIQ
jgi:tetratricopeptide (TPR) repeat protein